MIEQTSFADFLDFLEIERDSWSSISAMLADSSQFYRQFAIPKRKGGFRTICSPYPSLATVQQQILVRILEPLRVHERAFAYRKGLSAIQHAALHAGNDELLTLDINNFFGTVSQQMVFQVFADAGLSSRFSRFASLLCCLKGVLPQGASTSPVLSNLIFFQIDNRLSGLADKLDLTYSRYADDIAFSGQRVPRALVVSIEKILGSKGFRLNPAKTQLKLAGYKKIITGVSVSTGVIRAPKAFKRNLRTQIYQLERHAGNLGALPALDPLIYERILGRLNYLLQIEPDNSYALAKKELLSSSHQKFLSQVSWDEFLRIGEEGNGEDAGRR